MKNSGNRFIGILGIVWGILLTPIAILMNKYFGATEPFLLTYITGFIFLVAGVYLVVKNKKNDEQ